MDDEALLLLRAARETGVLDALATSAATPEEVAAETGVTERAARITVAALHDLGLLERVGDGYEPTNRMLGFLTKTDVRSVGSLPHRLDALERWIALPETMRTGTPPDPPEDWTVNAVGAAAVVDEAVVRACVTAAHHANPDADRILDASGGAGTFAREFARRGFDVTLVAAPDVVELVEPHLRHERVELVAGDPLGSSDSPDSLPAGFDLAFRSRTDRALSSEEYRAFLQNAFDALAPGGAVALTDHVRGRSPEAAMAGARALATTEAGDAHPEAAFREWLADAGFADAEVTDVPGTEVQAVTARRPRH